MSTKISVVINTLNEQTVIERAIKSVKWADEILVCDMNSEDDTAIIAKKAGARLVPIKRQPFVELARNLSISKASGDWILILDPDEEISETLATKLREITDSANVVNYVEVPRKNIIFNKWIVNSMWWPDYNIRFFKKGKVNWSNKIHMPPTVEGQGIKLPNDERFGIIHHHYTSIDQFLARLNRYTTIQAKELVEQGYKFKWQDLVSKPLSEFLGRYFANRGFDDGLHGLILCLLQAFSFLVVYIKIWELEGFKEQNIALNDLKVETKAAGQELNYWFKYGNLSKNRFKRFIQKAQNKIG